MTVINYRKFLLAPSETANVIINFSLSTKDDVILQNDTNFPFADGDETDSITGTVMKFIIKPEKVQDPSQTRYRLYLNSEIVDSR